MLKLETQLTLQPTTSTFNTYNNGNGGYNGDNSNFSQGNNGYHQSRYNNSAMIAITAATVSTFGLTAEMTSTDVDPSWTIDSGCTRHVTYNQAWFTTTTPYTGWITVGGKNQIPILAIGDISLKVIDSKG